MTAGRVLLLVFGSLILLVGLAVFVAGGAVLGLHLATEDEGFFTSGSLNFARDSRAIVSEDMDIVVTASDAPFDSGWPGDLGTLRLAGSSNSPGKDIFIGIGRANDVTAYLGGAAYDVVTELNIRPFEVEYRRNDGAATPAPPASQTFWDISAVGPGTQAIQWDVREGMWAIVVMNADASPGVDVSMRLGVRVPFIFPVSIGLLSAGFVLLLIGGLLVFLGARGGR